MLTATMRVMGAWMVADRIVVMTGCPVSFDAAGIATTTSTTLVADVGIAMVIGGIGEIAIGEMTTIEGGAAGDRHS